MRESAARLVPPRPVYFFESRPAARNKAARCEVPLLFRLPALRRAKSALAPQALSRAFFTLPRSEPWTLIHLPAQKLLLRPCR